MPNKSCALIDWVYEKHITVCHGTWTLERWSMALLSSQTQNHHISNIDKIVHVNRVKFVLFVVSIAYYAKQSISTYRLCLWKALYVMVGGHWKDSPWHCFFPNSQLSFFKYWQNWPSQWGENCIICSQQGIICQTKHLNL